MYILVKHIHLTCVALSLSLLLLRFFWMTKESAMMEQKWVKIVPHVIDTLLLLSALTLCVLINQYPFVQPWLTEKLLAVIAYIAMGFMCFKGRTKGLRTIAVIGAVGWIAVIGKLAVTKTPVFL